MSNKESISDRLTGGIWDRISGFFTSMWSGVWEGLVDSLHIITDGLMNTITSRTGFRRFVGLPSRVNKASKDFELPPEVEKIINTLQEDGTASGATAALFYTVIYQLLVATQTIPAMVGKARLKANKTFTPSAVTMDFLINLYYKNPELKTWIIDKAAENGYCEDDIFKMFESARAVIGSGEIRELNLRNLISDAETVKLMKQQGYDEDSIAKIKEIFYRIPPVNDIVRMAVREAFTPEVVTRYGLHSDIPADFIINAKKAGLDEQWSKAYWAAHWELPSLSNAFEMFHRGVIGKEDIDLLLKTQDVMPFWRDKLTQIAYSPYTRVDVRRMYQAGVLTEEDVFRSYLDIGYDEDKAAKMTEFTIAYTQTAERDLTKADVLDGYKKALLSQDETFNYLQNIGYSESESAYYIARCDFDIAKERKNLSTTNIKKMFIKNIIDVNKVYELLGKLNISAKEVEYLINLWETEKSVKDADFPIGALHKAFKTNIIDEGEYRNELQGKGFADKYIAWFIQIYGGK